MICTHCGQSSDRLSEQGRGRQALTDAQWKLISAGLCIACAVSRSETGTEPVFFDDEFDYGKPFPEELR